ncbi:patatin-like phospholipase family protein [Chitinophaga polysaccharea]|uniref:patatin-like phospholipase family protein n=1 Tax=Chitinophaga TaxID=79328 RepID=UPI001455D198|nr:MULTISPECIES: patatin-like phospholipase family protein [Chitinophaga]NLR56864.1 patatin-like phospholipase family protein [Chitinophaga polysaccharea]NLU93086.1 patatin-like phospholipase family protein [Chitinophaga sp. Ak27]
MNELKHPLPVRRPFVLSGGGARGYAHLGVLKAFAEQNIFPEAIAATSAGSIAAAFICDGYTTDEVREIFQRHKLGLSMQWRNWRAGFLSLKKVGEVLEKTLRHKTFDGLDIPLYVTATNFVTGDQTIFQEGAIIPAVLAASSVPLLFQPVQINNTYYVDGGLSGNLPIEPLLADFRQIIGVHVNPLTPYNPAGGFLANVERTLHLAIREPVLKNRQLCSQFIEPAALGQFGMFEFNKLENIYTTGYEYTKKLLLEQPVP